MKKLCITLALLLLLSISVISISSQDIQCTTSTVPAGDISCLIAAINSANGNPDVSTINLEYGFYEFVQGDNDTDGYNALPLITSPIVVEGNGAVLYRSGNIVFRFFQVNSSGDLTLKDIQLRNGRATVTLGGGAILNIGGTVTLNNATLFGNTTSTLGGAIHNRNGSLIVTNSDFIKNVANVQGSGGAIYNRAAPGDTASLTVSRSWFTENEAANIGGALYNNNATAFIGTSIFNTNTSTNRGGAIFAFSGSVNVNQSVFTGNSVQTSDNQLGRGGAINVEADATLVVTDSRLQANSAEISGGAINNVGNTTINNSCIITNVTNGFDILNTASMVLDASNNWWGTPNGPSTAINDTVESVSSNVNSSTPLVSDPGCPENTIFWLNSRDPNPSISQNTLEDGQTYLITIEGTFSTYYYDVWNNGDCDTDNLSEPNPLYPVRSSIGFGRVGTDAEYVFSLPSVSGPCTNNLPLPNERDYLEFSTNGGISWIPVQPLGTGYNPRHVYSYPIVGQGQPLQIRYIDIAYDDNYGFLRVSIDVSDIPPQSDIDEDGVPDVNDACPTEQGPPRNTGCPLDSDRDGDALLDIWETEGQGYDHDGDGIPDLELFAMGARPDHKDIFVYYDWTFDATTTAGDALCPQADSPATAVDYCFKPPEASLQLIRDAFNNAPVVNPDGQDGISIWFIPGFAIPEIGDGYNYSEINVLGFDSVFSWGVFDNIKTIFFPDEWSPIAHYMLSARQMWGRTESGLSRVTPLNNNGSSDFLITLGHPEHIQDYLSGEIDLVIAYAGTIMHELGHNLGLGHGGVNIDANGNRTGANTTGSKPNHLSVMNYSFQTRGLYHLPNGNGVFQFGLLDYSKFGASELPALDEFHLNEPSGFNGSASTSNYGTLFYCRVTLKELVFGPSGVVIIGNLQDSSVDWNCDGDKTDTDVRANINGRATIEQGLGILQPSHNEWDYLIYSGGAVGGFGVGDNLPMEVDYSASPELPWDELIVPLPGTGTDLIILNNADPNIIEVNGSLIYTLTVSNLGPSNASNVIIADILPDGIMLVSVETSQGVCTIEELILTCEIDSLPMNTEASVTLKVIPSISGVITNSAGVVSDEYDPVINNNISHTDVQVLEDTTPPVINLSQNSLTVDEGSQGIVDISVLDISETVLEVNRSELTNLGDNAYTWTDVFVEGPASETITFTATDSAGNVATEELVVLVTNISPTVDAGADISIFSGEFANISASFTDPSIVDTHTATIDFDDGNGAQVATLIQNAGSGSVTASHQYFKPSDYGEYNVQVCVTDDDGGTGCDNLIVTVYPLLVQIDIKPNETPNCFNNNGNGVIPVAILGREDFDVTQIDPATVTLDSNTVRAAGKSNKLLAHYEDVNNDTFVDLIVQIEDEDGTYQQGETIASLTGILYDGRVVQGGDTVCVTQ